MKRILASLLLFVFVLTACTSQTEPGSQSNAETTTTVSESVAKVKTYAYPAFSETSINDAYYINELAYQLAAALEENESVIVESIKPIYVSQEYINELAYNIRENIYYGYKLSELDAQFGGARYAFTVEGGKTVAVPFVPNTSDAVIKTIVKNTAIGAGVILLCVTVSIVTGGAGTPVAVSAAHVIFTAAATSVASGAAIGIATGGVFKGATSLFGYVSNGEEVNWAEVGKAAAVGASDGFKWGAVVGAVTGGISGAVNLHTAGQNAGTYRDLTEAYYGTLRNAGEEIHHVIPDAAASDILRGDGLAIKMAKADHRMLTSTGSTPDAVAFRGEIKTLLGAGKRTEAFIMGIDDIIEKTSSKYLAEITQLKKLTGLF